ncbi:MAG: adenylate/guanylate cyclase domain-containing protein [Saprospiraceae bacterium]
MTLNRTFRKFNPDLVGIGKFILILLLPLQTASAQTLVDSLINLLKTAPADTHRVALLTELAWRTNESDTDGADSIIQEAIALAQKLDFKPGEATAWNGLGVVEEIRGNYRKAIGYYETALALRQSLSALRGTAGTHTNLGNAYESLGELPAAISHHRESLTAYESLRDTLRMARAHSNISGVLALGGAYPEAFAELNKARLLLENQGDVGTTFKIYTQLGHNRFDLDMFAQAKDWYGKSLLLRQKSGDSVDIADGLVDLGNALDELDDTDSSKLAVQFFQQALQIYRQQGDQPSIGLVCNNLGDGFKHLGQYEEALLHLRESERIRQEMNDEPGLMETYNTLNDVLFRQGKTRESLEYTRRYADIAEKIGNENFRLSALKDFARAHAKLGDYAKAYDYQKRYNELRFKVMDERRAQNIETQQALTSVQERQLALDRERTNTALREAELARARTFRNALLGGAVLLVLLVGLLFSRNRLRARANRLLTTKNAAIERERERADTLLQNILPEKTAEELKTFGTVKPVHYESVTVFFSDFKNFTTIAEAMSPAALVKELDEHFRLFDAIVVRHGLEKIKTIGDAYMCAGGLPEPNETHALDTVRAALEMQHTLRQMAERKAAEGKPFFEMRIGIHSGPVVAGVVGSHKFAYDIWGDTVNTAARLEQGGEPGKINISETTWEKVRGEFACTFRGKLAAKNKGEIAMYFVDGAGEAS